MKKTAIAVLCTAALALTACGEEKKDEAAEQPATLTEAQFVKQANKLCRASEKELDRLAKANGVDDAASLTRFVTTTALRKMRDLVDQIDTLREPAELSDGVDDLLAEVSSEIDRIEKKPLYILDDKSFAKANRKATALGLKDCAE